MMSLKEKTFTFSNPTKYFKISCFANPDFIEKVMHEHGEVSSLLAYQWVGPSLCKRMVFRFDRWICYGSNLGRWDFRVGRVGKNYRSCSVKRNI